MVILVYLEISPKPVSDTFKLTRLIESVVEDKYTVPPLGGNIKALFIRFLMKVFEPSFSIKAIKLLSTSVEIVICFAIDLELTVVNASCIRFNSFTFLGLYGNSPC